MTDPTLRHGVYLTFYCHVRSRYNNILVTEWLLEQAKHDGIGGGSVFRATAGFGRNGVLREEAFFELADDLPAKVEFLLDTSAAERMLTRVRAAGVNVVYALTPADFAVLGTS